VTRTLKGRSLRYVTQQPAGTVTFLLSDIEGSTKLLSELGPEPYARALEDHRRILRDAFGQHGGYEVDYEGDAFVVAFQSAYEAVAAAEEAQRALTEHPWPNGHEFRVRMGIHSGEPLLAPPKYVGIDLHTAARIMAAGHGGQVLVSQVTRDLVERELPVGVSLSDLGEHQLKDLTEPLHLHQLVIHELPVEFPPLKSLGSRPTNLPGQLTSLVGRRGELQKLKKLLLVEHVRLLTLTGPGGTGKTRLALELASDVSDSFPSGTFVVFLAPIADPTRVLPAFALALKLREAPGQSLVETLRDHLQDRELLVVLDNFEHVVDAARDLAALLSAAPKLSVVVTSRAPLRIAGEREYEIEPLPSEDAEILFTERALSVNASLDAEAQINAIRKICARVDRLPLAIELAATRTRSLTPDALLARLESSLELLTSGMRDTDERHMTLRSTIEWSYRLLKSYDRAVLRCLAVFRGGWTLQAAEAVCLGDKGTRESMVLVLDRLVEQSLIRVSPDVAGEPRYFMLETIREFAAEQLEVDGEYADTHKRHADWVTTIVELEAADFVGLATQGWLERLDAEADNIASALSWHLTVGDWEGLARLAAFVWQWWDVRGQWSEGRRWLEAARAPLPESPLLRARVLYGAVVLADLQGDRTEAKGAAQQAVALFRDGSNDVELGRALGRLGMVYTNGDELDEGVHLLEEATALARRTGDLVTLEIALTNLGNAALKEEEFERARSLCREALDIAREVGDQHGVIVNLYDIAWAHLEEGDLEQAGPLFAEVISLADHRGWREGVLFPLEALAKIALQKGEQVRAAKLFGAADGIREQLGQDDSRVREETFKLRERLGEPEFLSAFHAGKALALAEAIAVAVEDPSGVAKQE
jgi:predicted ATPase/class 3 adenylate cyclase